MNLQEFRLLHTPEGDRHAAQVNWVANLILDQNPRLRRGDNMNGQSSMMLNGKFTFGGNLVLCVRRKISVHQLNGHPWIDLNVEDRNYLHMYKVALSSPFDDNQIGNSIPVSLENGDHIHVPLTQDMIDQTTSIHIVYGLSK